MIERRARAVLAFLSLFLVGACGGSTPAADLGAGDLAAAVGAFGACFGDG